MTDTETATHTESATHAETETRARTEADSSTGAELASDLDRLTREHTRWRTRETINLNAATNSLSDRARGALASSLADKGISSGLHSRHHQGGRFIDEIEERVAGLVSEMFSGQATDLRAPTGSLANGLVIAALAPKNRSIMTGGASSLGHTSLRNEGWGGRLAADAVATPLDPNGIDLDLTAIEREVIAHEPAMIVVGSQVMMFPISLRELRAIADKVGATVVYDAAHPLGLIAGGVFQNPLAEGADVLTASTQKSLPGPVGGLIVTRKAELMEPIYSATNALMSNYQNSRVLSLGYTIAEMQSFGSAYASACVTNARVLAGALAAEGLRVLFAERGFTDSNLFLVEWGSHAAAQNFAERCEAANLIVSTTRLPGAPEREPRFGSRIGVQDLTRHGLGPAELIELATVIGQLSRGAAPETIKPRMTALAAEYSTVYYCFENGLPMARPPAEQ